MNELMIFNNPEFGRVRTLEENGAVLFCGTDVRGLWGTATHEMPFPAIAGGS